MTTLHIEPDELRDLSRLLERSAMQLFDAERQLQRAAASLEIAWQGGSSEALISELQAIKLTLHQHIDELYAQILQLLRQADLWDELDQNWQKDFYDLFTGIFHAESKP